MNASKGNCRRVLSLRKYIPSPPVLRLFIFMGIVWAAVVGPFSSVIILRHFGASSPQIGIVTAICSVISMVFQPVWGVLSDKFKSPRKILCFCLGMSGVFFGAIFFTENLFLVIALIMLDMTFRCGVISLLDSHTLSEINALPGLQYSFIRMAGSIFYGGLSFVYSGVINARGVMSIIPLSLCIAVAAIFWGFFAAKGKGETERGTQGNIQKIKPNLTKEAFTLLKNHKYILFILFVALYALSSQPLFVFIIDYVTAVGRGPGDVPVIHALRCVVELPLFIFIGYMGTRIGAKKLMMTGVCFAVLYTAGLLFAHNYALLVVSHMSGAAGFILCLTGRMRYINEITPEAVRSTSITVMGACEVGLGAIAGNLVAGFILGTYGTRALTFVSLAALVLSMAVLMLLFKRKEEAYG
jgi:PPP family 3-phenylpropionic acid transporter